MGKKGKWLNVVKKVFSTESKENEKSQMKLELEAPGQSDPVDSSAFHVTAKDDMQSIQQTVDDKLVEVEEQKGDVYSEVAAAENSIGTVQVAGDTLHLKKPEKNYDKSREETAAIKIQTSFRGHVARRALRSTRGQERLKSLLEGSSVKRQATTTLHYMQTLARVQAQVHSRRIRMSEENQALQQQMLLKHERDLEKLKMGDEWDDSLQTKEQIEAGLLNKQEAALRRERAMAYAFNHQWKSSSRSVNPMYLNPSNPQWGWSWLERWMAAKSWEAKKNVDKDFSKDDAKKNVDKGLSIDNASVKSSNQNVKGGEIVKANSRSTVPDKPSPGVQKSNHNANRKSPATPPVKAHWTTSKRNSASPMVGSVVSEDDSRTIAKAPWTTSKRNSTSPKVGSVVSEDESGSIARIRSERHRRHSIAGISVRDDESLASSSFPSYMAPTVSTRARSRNQSPSHDTVETPDKLAPSVKKKLSYPASPSINRRHSEPPKVSLELEKV